MTTAEELFEKFEIGIEEDDEEAVRGALAALRADFAASRERSLAEINWRWVLGPEEEDEVEASELAHRTDEHGSLLGWLEKHVTQWPEDADVRYELGALYLELDREADARDQWLAVLDQDIKDDADADIGGPEDERFVLQAAEEVLSDLPETFAALLSAVPVLVETRPARELVEKGFDPRAYGLFEGPTQMESSGLEPPPAPTKIVLYLSNLAADFPEEEQLAIQVQITILHEIGHYFGLEEEDMERLGWD
ncbi:MAG: metallopeptidase family protein [Myxococcota bacterium]